MKIGEVFSAFRTWVATWFTASTRDKFLSVLDHAAVYLPYALPIVEAIDKELKPALRQSHLAAVMTVEDFLRKWCREEDYEAAQKLALRIAYLPLADLLVNVALFLLQRAKPDSVGISILRLTVELAYNVYKGSKEDEAQTKIS